MMRILPEPARAPLARDPSLERDEAPAAAGTRVRVLHEGVALVGALDEEGTALAEAQAMLDGAGVGNDREHVWGIMPEITRVVSWWPWMP
jgi:hypothetical protein